MKKISKLLIAFIALINLSACMTTQEAAAKYDAMSSQDLCMAYISNENYNIWQPDRLASIQRRGLDCRPYLAAGMRKKMHHEHLRLLWVLQLQEVKQLFLLELLYQQVSQKCVIITVLVDNQLLLLHRHQSVQ